MFIPNAHGSSAPGTASSYPSPSPGSPSLGPPGLRPSSPPSRPPSTTRWSWPALLFPPKSRKQPQTAPRKYSWGKCRFSVRISIHQNHHAETIFAIHRTTICTTKITTVLVTDFNFDLPEELIAQSPPAVRGTSRMLVLDRETGEYRDDFFRNLPMLLKPGDLLVLNDSRVIPARIYATRARGQHTQHSSPDPS